MKRDTKIAQSDWVLLVAYACLMVFGDHLMAQPSAEGEGEVDQTGAVASVPPNNTGLRQAALDPGFLSEVHRILGEQSELCAKARVQSGADLLSAREAVEQSDVDPAVKEQLENNFIELVKLIDQNAENAARNETTVYNMDQYKGLESALRMRGDETQKALLGNNFTVARYFVAQTAFADMLGRLRSDLLSTGSLSMQQDLLPVVLYQHYEMFDFLSIMLGSFRKFDGQNVLLNYSQQTRRQIAAEEEKYKEDLNELDRELQDEVITLEAYEVEKKITEELISDLGAQEDPWIVHFDRQRDQERWIGELIQSSKRNFRSGMRSLRKLSGAMTNTKRVCELYQVVVKIEAPSLPPWMEWDEAMLSLLVGEILVP